MLKKTQPFPQKSHECALKLTDLWIKSLFDLNYKFINWSFAFSPIYYFKEDNGKLQVKVITVTFLDAEATVNVLTASNNDVKLAETRAVDFV